MSKYEQLWCYLKESGMESVTLTYEEIKNILGFELDHSFLQSKKELIDFGYVVNKISMKNKTISFKKA